MGARGPNESCEQRMPVTRRRGELWMELGRHKPRVVRELDHFHEVVARETRELQAGVLEPIQEVVVELVAMAMALHDDVLREDFAGAGARTEDNFLSTQAHGRTLVGLLGSLLRAASQVLPLGDHRNDRMRSRTVELRAIRVRQPQHVAAVFNNGNLHAETDTEIRHALLAGKAYCLD